MAGSEVQNIINLSLTDKPRKGPREASGKGNGHRLFCRGLAVCPVLFTQSVHGVCVHSAPKLSLCSD